MNAKYSVGFFILAGAAWAADSSSPLDLKPGMWEHTSTLQVSGAPAIPEAVLAKMTPEQRAMIEARFKERTSQIPKTTVTKRCISKEDLSKPLQFGEDRGACVRSMESSSAGRQEIRIECVLAGVKTHGTIRIEAVDSEHVKVATQIVSGDGPSAMKINSTGTGKWIGAGCAGEPPK